MTCYSTNSHRLNTESQKPESPNGGTVATTLPNNQLTNFLIIPKSHSETLLVFISQFPSAEISGISVLPNSTCLVMTEQNDQQCLIIVHFTFFVYKDFFNFAI